jgi:hypothetical protein
MEILLIVIFGIGFYCGWKVNEKFFVHIIKTDPESIEEACRIARRNLAEDQLGQSEVELETEDGKLVKTRGVELAIEMVGGVMYAYSKATNQFIAQGNTIEDLLKIAHKRFPGQTFFGDLPEEGNQNS